VDLQSFDLVGVPELRKLFVSQVTQMSANADEPPVIDLPALATLIDDIAADGPGWRWKSFRPFAFLGGPKVRFPYLLLDQFSLCGPG
jgi:hypothetical protein